MSVSWNTDLFEAEILQNLPGNRFDCLPELDLAGKNIFKSSDELDHQI